MTASESAPVPRRATVADVDAISALHASCIAEGFLVTLGPRFLRRLYRRVVLSPRAFAFVVDAPTGVVDRVAASSCHRRSDRQRTRALTMSVTLA